MTKHIGDIPISSVQDVSIEYSKEYDEMDLIDENVNMVFIGEEALQNLSIDFTLNSQSHPTKDSIEEQKEEIKKVLQRDKTENGFEINGQRGYISAENVSIPETSQETNIIVGSLEGKFLPWPKHFPENIPTIIVIVSGSINSELILDGDIGRNRGINGNIITELKIDSPELLIWKFLNVEISSSLTIGAGDEYTSDEYSNGSYGITQPILNLASAMVGGIQGSFKIQDNLYSQSYGNLYGSTEPLLNVYIYMESFFNGNFSSSGDLRNYDDIGYGNDYGYDYGGLIFDYGSGIYGRDVYAEAVGYGSNYGESYGGYI